MLWAGRSSAHAVHSYNSDENVSKTVLNRRLSVALISSLLCFFNSPNVRGSLTHTWSLKCPQSGAERSGDLAGQALLPKREVMDPGSVAVKQFTDSRSMLAVAHKRSWSSWSVSTSKVYSIAWYFVDVTVAVQLPALPARGTTYSTKRNFYTIKSMH